jgi:hypothetical protein
MKNDFKIGDTLLCYESEVSTILTQGVDQHNNLKCRKDMLGRSVSRLQDQGRCAKKSLGRRLAFPVDGVKKQLS